jgi:hypothetical protein
LPGLHQREEKRKEYSINAKVLPEVLISNCPASPCLTVVRPRKRGSRGELSVLLPGPTIAEALDRGPCQIPFVGNHRQVSIHEGERNEPAYGGGLARAVGERLRQS